MVKYRGMGFQIHGVYLNKFVNNGENDKVGIGVIGNWNYYTTIKPVAFFENSFISSTKKGEGQFGKSIVLSFYYERLNFMSAQFNGTKVFQMVSSEFINKYANYNRFGIKIGFALY